MEKASVKGLLQAHSFRVWQTRLMRTMTRFHAPLRDIFTHGSELLA